MSDNLQVSLPVSPTAFSFPANQLYTYAPVQPMLAPTAAPAVEGRRIEHRSISPQFQVAHYMSVKPLVDRIVVAVLMIAALPIMVVVGLAILISDGRPVFYRQTRVGKQGRLFRIWKFRTMRTDAERDTGAVWSSENDTRVTPLGRWLRCTHLDEIPQFFNVLTGDMNLIGPRPERPEIVRELIRELPQYARRLSIGPGITGLAQLRLGYDRTVADVEKKLQLDLKYIGTTTVVKDAILLLQTIPHIVMQLIKNGRSREERQASVETKTSFTVGTTHVSKACDTAPRAPAMHLGQRIPIPHVPNILVSSIMDSPSVISRNQGQ